MTRAELLAALLAERFPTPEELAAERPPTRAEIERRRRILLGEKEVA